MCIKIKSKDTFLSTEDKIKAVLLYRENQNPQIICSRFNISKSSLQRWHRRFDGTANSLANKDKTKRSGVIPIDIRIKVVQLFRENVSREILSRIYNVSPSSISRWNKMFDGTIESLKNRSG